MGLRKREDRSMVHLNVIEARMAKLGIRASRWSKPELRELQNILMDGEEIVCLSNGRYFAGFATIVATDVRLLIIDKRPFFLTVEDIRYDMISQMDYSSRLLDATIHIFTVNKQHRFTSYRYRKQLQDLTKYVQQRVMELRHPQQSIPSSTTQQPAFQPPPEVDPLPEPPQYALSADTAPVPPAPSPKNYRYMASRLSGRILGPVAVKAAHHHRITIPNPYVKASLAVTRNGNWFKSYNPQPDNSQIVVQPEA